MENKNIQALTKQNELLETVIELPLTVEEKQELRESEYRIQKAQDLMENAALVIAQELSKIRAKKLYRESYKTFEDYIKNTFDYSRPYGQNMAQYGDFINVAIETLQSTVGENNPMGKFFSLNAIVKMTVATNQLGKYLGLANSEFDRLKPIINNSIKVMVESMPRAKNGISPKLSPDNIEKFYEALNGFIQEKVEEENLLNENSREQVISQISKRILENSEAISLRIDYGKRSLKTESEPEKNITSRWRSVELLAKEYIESLEEVLDVQDVSESNLGYDLEVLYKDGKKIYVEVKKVEHFNQKFKLTRNEFNNVNFYKDSYRIALVVIEPFQIRFTSNPAKKLNFTKVVERYSWESKVVADDLQEDL